MIIVMTAETVSISCGLGSAVAWGTGDFSAGLASRKGNLLKVVLYSQCLGGVALCILALLFQEVVPPVGDLVYGVLAGIFGNIGLVALYRGLALGRMGIVAPLSAVLTALMPIGYSALFQGLPGMGQCVGFGLFMVAVWLLSSADAMFRMTPVELGLSIVAGFGFGCFFIFIDRANDLSIFWPLVGARVASVTLLFAIVVAARKPSSPLTGQWIFIVITGVLDAAGNLLFTIAAHYGRLDVSAVLGSLYPAATVLLAWVVLKERLRPRQWAGVSAAFAALLLISI